MEDIDNITIERVEWISNTDIQCKLNIDDLISWISVDEKQLSIENEENFCDKNILKTLLITQNKLNSLSDGQLESARKRSNIFEKIGKSILLDRSAVKLANVDSLLNNMFTAFNSTSTKEIFSFAAIGGDPGGFVDYMLWKRGWHTKCFGFGNRKLYKTQLFHSDPLPFIVQEGPERNGDITMPKNLNYAIEHGKRINRNGLHIVLADVALPIYRALSSKEIISKRLHLCCCTFALATLKENGNFILKIFDSFTPFTVGLIYIMYKCFRQITIVKPHSSRPANGERYLICKGKLSNTVETMKHLTEVNETIVIDETEISELVSMETLKTDTKFYDFIRNSNNEIMQKQIKATERLVQFANDLRLKENELQEAIKIKFSEIWNIPIKDYDAPAVVVKQLPDEYVRKLFPKFDEITFNENELEKPGLIHLDKNWFFLPIENIDDRTLYLCQDKSIVYKYDKNAKIWTLITDVIIMLPKDTLIYGEIITVYDEKMTKNHPYLHIIDGYVLGGRNIYNERFLQRSALCHQMILCIGNQRPFINGKKVVAVESHAKKFLKDLSDFKQKVTKKMINGISTSCVNIGLRKYFAPKALLFVSEQNRQQKVWTSWNDDS